MVTLNLRRLDRHVAGHVVDARHLLHLFQKLVRLGVQFGLSGVCIENGKDSW